MILFNKNRKYARDRQTLQMVRVASVTFGLFALAAPLSAATTFGIYDARTMGMGGVSVASSNNDNAQFYNAALLAYNDEIEERTQDARFLFPLIVPQVSEAAIDLEEITANDMAESISQTIRNFNATPDALTAHAVVDATANLDGALGSISGEDLLADLYVGVGVSEPGKFQGAGFFMGVRLLAGGQSSVSETDRAVLGAYQEGLTFVASAGAEGAAHPELFDANGALIDPSAGFDSESSAAGAAITEIGVAMSRQMSIFGSPVAAGISLKVMDIETFEDEERVVDGRIDVQRNNETDVRVNVDVGLVKEVGERWRLGLAVKDLIPYDHDTSLGTKIRFRPRPRLGAAYQAGQLQIAFDADLIENEPLGFERPTQEAAIGAEWAMISPLKLRAGYRHDIRGNRDGIVSVGVGTLWKRLAVDIAYAQGSDTRAAALQFGVAF